MVPTKISSGDDAKELLKAFANRCKFDVYLHACRLDYAGSESVEGSKKPMGEVFKKINSMKQICMDKARVLHHDTPDVLYSKYIEMLPTLSDDARTKWTTQLCIAYYNGLSQELKDKMDSREFDMPNLSQLTTKQAQHDALRLVRASASASFKVLHEEEQMMKRLLQR